MAKLLLAFGHKRLRGKDTAAGLAEEYLKYLGFEVHWLRFASPLKDGFGRGLLGLTKDQCNGASKIKVDEFWGETPAALLERAGPALRSIRPDILLKSVGRQVSQLPDGCAVLFSDLRYPNEAQFVRDAGGLCIRIDRDIDPTDGRSNTAETEVALDDWTGWDHIISNDLSIWHLELAVAHVIQREAKRLRFIG